jgi:DNA replication and repair protein RecF
MYLSSLFLLHFKNFTELEIQFSRGINGIVGKNGSGKTNILDAVHYLSMCKSYLNTIDRQNIQFNSTFFTVNGDWINEDKTSNVHCAFKLGAKKVVKFNKKEYEKLSEHIGKFPVVFISPYDGDLIAEGSELRRKWMDGILSQIDKEYLEQIQRYSKILEQRNALLKNMFEHRLFDRESIDIWDHQLVQTGTLIFEKRKEFISEFIPVFNKFYNEIGLETENVHVEYRSHLNDGDFLEQLKNAEKKDAFAQYTTVGIHKDDLIFTIKNHPVKKFGSQGQQKSFLIALRIAQYDWLKRHKGTNPVLLLDDIFDKLDNQRVAKLIELVTTDYFGQVLVTDTDPIRMKQLFEGLSIEKKLFEIENGLITTLL